MKKEEYNGWANRSTWLVILWLDNQSKEINDRAKEIAVVSDTTKQFISLIKPVLLETKDLWHEKDFDILQTNWIQVWEHFAPSTKY